MAKSTILNSVEEVIEDFRNGRIVIVVDDEDRENEGDFIVAAEKITPEIVNFMLKEGRGVLCAPLSEERCAELGLNMMEENNTSLLGTPFTMTAPPPYAPWPTPRPGPPTSAARGTSTRCVPARKVCCAVRGIPRPR